MEHRKIGFAFCGSFCTYSQAMEVLERVQSRYGDVLPIVSEAGAATDTRFGAAHDFMREMERICGRRWWTASPRPSPLGPGICWMCWSSVPARATPWPSWQTASRTPRLPWRPRLTCATGAVVLCPATNDGLAASARNIGVLLDKKNVYFVPFRQDDPARKPTSLVADFSLVPAAIDAALEGRQLQPVLLGPQEAD